MISFTKAFKRLVLIFIILFLLGFVGFGIAAFNQAIGKYISGLSIILCFITFMVAGLLVLFGKNLDFIEYDKEKLDKEIMSAFQRKDRH